MSRSFIAANFKDEANVSFNHQLKYTPDTYKGLMSMKVKISSLNVLLVYSRTIAKLTNYSVPATMEHGLNWKLVYLDFWLHRTFESLKQPPEDSR